MLRRLGSLAFAVLLALATYVTTPAAPVNAQPECPPFSGPVSFCYYQWQYAGQTYFVRVPIQNPTDGLLTYRVTITHEGAATQVSSPSVTTGYLTDCEAVVPDQYCTVWTAQLSPGESAQFSLPARTNAVTWVRSMMTPLLNLPDGSIQQMDGLVYQMPVYGR